MKTNIIRVIVFLLVVILPSLLIYKDLGDFAVNTIYAVVGIMFSIGLGLIVSFNFQGVKNKRFIENIRLSLCKIRNRYIYYFSASTIFYVICQYYKVYTQSPNIIISIKYDVALNTSLFIALFMFWSIAYFIINLIAIEKLNQDLYDKLNDIN